MPNSESPAPVEPRTLTDDEMADAMAGPQAAATIAAVTPTLTGEEAQSLTIWGEHISAQIRSYAALKGNARVASLVLAHVLRAPRSREDGRPYVIGADDARKLRDLLNAATARGEL